MLFQNPAMQKYWFPRQFNCKINDFLKSNDNNNDQINKNVWTENLTEEAVQ